MNFLDLLGSQILALVGFFGFPIVQYVLLKRVARNEGLPELWYLPRYGFRLVIRNLPRKHILSDIRYRALLRRIVPASDSASVATYDDKTLLAREKFFVFPGNDQVLVSFKLECEPDGDSVRVIQTHKLGYRLGEYEMGLKDVLVVDFTATLQNLFNFNLAIARRIEITGSRMREIVQSISDGSDERRFSVSRVRSIGSQDSGLWYKPWSAILIVALLAGACVAYVWVQKKGERRTLSPATVEILERELKGKLSAVCIVSYGGSEPTQYGDMLLTALAKVALVHRVTETSINGHVAVSVYLPGNSEFGTANDPLVLALEKANIRLSEVRFAGNDLRTNKCGTMPLAEGERVIAVGEQCPDAALVDSNLGTFCSRLKLGR